MGLEFDFETGLVFRTFKTRNRKCYGNQPYKNVYYDIKINGKMQRLHRVIYSTYHNIPLDKLGQIDHLDRNTKNNRITNLRLVTHSGNILNRTKRLDNKSGHKNISYDKQVNRWVCSIVVDKTTTFKRFDNISDAIKYRDEFYASHPEIYFGNQ